MGVLQELRDERHFPGMQPVGIYPIHIIVKNGRTMLLGIVDSAADRQIAEVRAREATGVFNVENGLMVAGQGRTDQSSERRPIGHVKPSQESCKNCVRWARNWRRPLTFTDTHSERHFAAVSC